MRRTVPHQPRHDVAADAVPAPGVGGVRDQRLLQHLTVEHVVAHGRERLVRPARQGGRRQRLLQERLDPVLARSRPHHAEGNGRPPRHRESRHRDPGAPGQVALDQLRRVHPVHVVGPEHGHQVGPLAADQVQRLVDRIGRPGLPVRPEPLLGRHRRHVVAEQAVQLPGGGDVPVEAVALVLGEHADLRDAGVDQVGQREVHQPVQAAERDGGFRPVFGQGREPLARRAREHDAKASPTGHLATSRPPMDTLRGRVPRRGSAKLSQAGRSAPAAVPTAARAGGRRNRGRTRGSDPPPVSRPGRPP